MITWRFAYQKSRKGPWEQYGRDAERFKNKIKTIESAIGYVFSEEHRARMYNYVTSSATSLQGSN